MNKLKYVKEAFARMPVISPTVMVGADRVELLRALDGTDNKGIELGVAEGWFSKRMLDSGRFSQLFGVDVYGDTHDSAEYKRALKWIGLEGNYKLLRMTFDDAIDLFPDQFFDFIYVDGFAHTGEEGGTTLLKWYPKLKAGGYMAGDDYHEDWPLVMWAVNHFAMQLGADLFVTEAEFSDAYSKYPSWTLRKKEADSALDLKADERLVVLGEIEKRRIYRQRSSRIWRFIHRFSSRLKRLHSSQSFQKSNTTHLD